jgi:plasmid maintenance system antidote protein VapI
MGSGLAYLNHLAQAQSLAWRNDFDGGGGYHRGMGAPRHDWYLKEWLLACRKKQADVVRDLGWNKAKISLMVHGKQAYTREEVNELAAYLQIDPHELLMHPDRAHRIRRLQDDMIRLVHDAEENPKKVSLN